MHFAFIFAHIAAQFLSRSQICTQLNRNQFKNTSSSGLGTCNLVCILRSFCAHRGTISVSISNLLTINRKHIGLRLSHMSRGTIDSAVTLRQTVKHDINKFLTEFCALGNNITFSSFKSYWNQRNVSTLHNCCPKRTNRSTWFNLMASCALDLLFQVPCFDLQTTVADALPMCVIVTEGIWNIFIVFFLYCLYHTRDRRVDNDVKIRISPRLYREIELSLGRWSHLGRFGDQGGRCWLLLLHQQALMFACYTGSEVIQSDVRIIIAFPDDAELGSTTRVCLDKLAEDNNLLASFAKSDAGDNDTILDIVSRNYDIVDSSWDEHDPVEKSRSLVVLPTVASSTGSLEELGDLLVLGMRQDGDLQLGGLSDSNEFHDTLAAPEPIRARGANRQVEFEAPATDLTADSRMLMLLQLERQIEVLEGRGTGGSDHRPATQKRSEASPRISLPTRPRAVENGSGSSSERTGRVRARATSSKKRPVLTTATNVPRVVRRAVMAGADSGATREGLLILEQLEQRVG